MANTLYNNGRAAFLTGSINAGSDTLKVALVTSGYTFSQSHQYLSDIGANTLGTDQTLTSVTTTSGTLNAANPTWTAVASGSTVSYLVIYKSTGTASTSPLIMYIDTASGLPSLTNGGNFTMSWDTGANKIFTL